jgi:hypothetical protein
MIEEVRDVGINPRDQIVKNQHLPGLGNQPVA